MNVELKRKGKFVVVVGDVDVAMAISRKVGVLEAHQVDYDDGWGWHGTWRRVPYSGTNATSLKAVWKKAKAEVACIKKMTLGQRERRIKQEQEIQAAKKARKPQTAAVLGSM